MFGKAQKPGNSHSNAPDASTQSEQHGPSLHFSQHGPSLHYSQHGPSLHSHSTALACTSHSTALACTSQSVHLNAWGHCANGTANQGSRQLRPNDLQPTNALMQQSTAQPQLPRVGVHVPDTGSGTGQCTGLAGSGCLTKQFLSAAAAAAYCTHEPLHSEKYGQFCVLGIDDDQVNLMVLEQLLSPEGWKIISAGDGEEAYEIIDGDVFPDFVFLDYTMNFGDSGLEICKKLRAAFGSLNIPIVMCTALTAGHSALDECLKGGATDYLLKPYERSKMVEKVVHYCGDKKLKEKGISIADLKSMDDTALRKAGVVVKSQRDKLLEAAQKA
eukprot:gene22007-29066_t